MTNFSLISSLQHSGQFCPIHLGILGAQETFSMLHVFHVLQTDGLVVTQTVAAWNASRLERTFGYNPLCIFLIGIYLRFS